jgi:nucleoside-triphosphatase
LPKRVLLITGSPGVGKTTILTEAVETLEKEGLKVGGMISREVRADGIRIGFEIVDLTSSKRGWLAQVSNGNGPQIGKYIVNLEDLEAIGAKSIIEAVGNCDVVVIDEIGPMELFSWKFKEAVVAALESQGLVLAVVHWKASDRFLIEVRSREDAEIFVATRENREKLVEIITSKALNYFSYF